MGSSNIIWNIVILLVVYEYSWVSSSNSSSSASELCGHTPYPTLCVQTLRGVNDVDDFMSALVNRTILEAKMPPFSQSLVSPQSHLAQMAIDYCDELTEMSAKRLQQALDLLKTSPEKHKSDIQTWVSAALTFHQTCKDTIHQHLHISTISDKMDLLSQLASNSLALVNRINGSRLPDGESFPNWVSGGDRKLLQATPAEIRADAVVAKDGSGKYKTVREAMEAATGSRFVIYVKAGTYNEKINCKKDGITLIGDGKYSTIITAADSVGKGSSLRGSATFTITGDGFIARDIGFENTAGPDGHQAVALLVSSDHSVLYRCSIAGYQDTLYAHSLRQFYRECDIYGTVDFIFGNAVALFQSCTLIFRRPRRGGAFNTILASGRTDPGQNTGFSVHNCKITVGSDFSPVKNSYDSYLGRPWKEYSRAVVMQTNIDGEISARGWMEWEGAGSSTYKNLYFGEYGNMGQGAGTSGRVNWPGFHVLGIPDASKFTVANFIGGNSWLPSTGITFISGL